MQLFLKIIIVIAVIAIFVISYLLNSRVKAPIDSDEELEKCAKCTNAFCKKSNKNKECEENNKNEE